MWGSFSFFNVVGKQIKVAWAGGHENYTFSETDGVTTLEIDLESDGMPENMKEMFAGMWPKALAELKELAESDV